MALPIVCRFQQRWDEGSPELSPFALLSSGLSCLGAAGGVIHSDLLQASSQAIAHTASTVLPGNQFHHLITHLQVNFKPKGQQLHQGAAISP